MSLANSSTVIIAIPGTNETQELNIQAARAAIARGEIGPTHWAWSPLHNDWKQVSEFPELQLPSSPTAKPVAMKAMPVAVAKNKVSVPMKTQIRTHVPVEEEPDFNYFKLFVFVLAIAVIGIAGGNYFLLDQPLRTNLAETSFATVPVHAHLGAFLQPNSLAIHILPTQGVQENNLADFLVNLAKSTPDEPFDQQPFKYVGLTSAWTSQYVISGADWQSLGKMTAASADEKKSFILDHLLYPGGQHLVKAKSDTAPDALTQIQDKAWENLYSTLVHS